MLKKILNQLLGRIKISLYKNKTLPVFREFRYFKNTIFLAFVSSIVAAFLEGITVGLIAAFLQGLTNPSQPPIQTGIRLIDTWLLATEASPNYRIYHLTVVLLLLIWLRASSDFAASVCSRRVSLELVTHLRKRIFEQLQSLHISFFSKVRESDLVNVAQAEVNQIQYAIEVLFQFSIQAFKVIAYLASMLLLSWQLFFISTALFLLISVAFSNLSSRVKSVSFDIPKTNKEYTSNLLSFINGIRTIHASVAQDFERASFYQAADEIYRARMRLTWFSALVSPLMQAFGITILLAIVVISYRWLINQGGLSASVLLTFLFVLLRTTPLVSALNNMLVRFLGSLGSMNAVGEFLESNDKPYLQDGKHKFKELIKSIDLVSVDFGYAGEKELVLHNINLSIPKGKTTALVGGSGAGKSTLANLLLRFHDPTSGKVLIDGIDLREFQVNSLRRRMSIVSQDTFIFNASVAENIAYGFEKIELESIKKAAQLANAFDFIMDLPDGFDTILGDRGIRLSGGQRQRISIARALMRNPDILILDEATSALDSITEELIQESIDHLSKNRTVVVIAHRLSTVMQADKVVVLEKGHICEEGKYDELLEQRGKLWEFHNIQFNEEN